ncbi:Domain of uncharacterised function (DUF1983) [Neisseria flavescens]|uniref:phage tail tip fiber protein n=1 Tax=Neisseria flavescens TaxID=484 RepID=UPI000E018016|nr:Domain of uncharacterised function (DUF1983) [Neisseria flavescens]
MATTVANLENATRSTLTIKTEAQTAGGQKVVTGISADGRRDNEYLQGNDTGDKFEVVSANRGNPVQPFVVKTVNGRAQVGINGRLDCRRYDTGQAHCRRVRLYSLRLLLPVRCAWVLFQ